MTDFLQPAPWLYKGEEPDAPEFAPGDPDGTKTVAGIAFQTDVAIQLRARQVNREAARQDRRKQLEALGETGWQRPSLREAYEQLEGGRQQPDIGQWRRTLNQDDALLHGSAEGDGHGILYSRKVNLIFGPSESGKSMFSFAIVAQEIQAGRHVVIIDFEDDQYGFVARMTDLGVHVEEFDPEGAKPGGAYYYPARLGMEDDDFALVKTHIDTHQGADDRVSLVVIDATTEAMSADGLNPDKAVEVAQWMASMPKRFATLGPGVAVIDHTGHENADRVQGSQHKKSGVDGVSLKVKRTQTFIPGRGGAAGIYIAKDRPGSIREQSVAADPDKPGDQEWRGAFVMNPPGGDHRDPFAMIGRHPSDLDRAPGGKEEEGRPSADDVMAELIDEAVRVTEENPGAGKSEIRKRMDVKASNDDKLTAIDSAVRLGRIRTEREPRGKLACYPILPEEQLVLTRPDLEKTSDLSP